MLPRAWTTVVERWSFDGIGGGRRICILAGLVAPAKPAARASARRHAMACVLDDTPSASCIPDTPSTNKDPTKLFKPDRPACETCAVLTMRYGPITRG